MPGILSLASKDESAVVQISLRSIEQPHLKNGDRQTDSATERLKLRGGEKNPSVEMLTKGIA